MSDAVLFYQQQIAAALSSQNWVKQIQESARNDFSRLKFPTKKDEIWKYASLADFLQQQFTVGDPSIASQTALTNNDYTSYCVNGVNLAPDNLRINLPQGVIVQSLHQAFEDNTDIIAPYFAKIMRHNNGFQSLNTAMLQSGLFIYIPPGVHLTAPLRLMNWQGQNMCAVHARNLIVADEDSSVMILHEYSGDKSISYFTNTVTEIYAGSGSVVQHCQLQRESKHAYHVEHLAVHQAKNSHFTTHALQFGGKYVRNDIHITLQESGASCVMNGIYTPTDKQQIDNHTVVIHAATDCLSEQDYKGILTGCSQAVFNGQIIVEHGSTGTQAKQQNKNLLLSTTAEVATKPQLDIYADDVLCTHGATVGNLDEDAIFYMETRGINREIAIQFLIEAFLMDNVRRIPDETIMHQIQTFLHQQIVD